MPCPVAHHRPGLPPAPPRVAALPVDVRGYPIPYFVGAEAGDTAPDFRFVPEKRVYQALKERRCWVCGQELGRFLAFTVGPMCAVNRVSSEPPSHRECAVYAAQACPFLSRPHMHRREGGEEAAEATPPPGVMLYGNPGLALVWVTRSYERITVERGRPGRLFEFGEPTEVLAFREGRTASTEEVREALVRGLPNLLTISMEDVDGAVPALWDAVARACGDLGVEPLTPAELGDVEEQARVIVTAKRLYARADTIAGRLATIIGQEDREPR